MAVRMIISAAVWLFVAGLAAAAAAWAPSEETAGFLTTIRHLCVIFSPQRDSQTHSVIVFLSTSASRSLLQPARRSDTKHTRARRVSSRRGGGVAAPPSGQTAELPQSPAWVCVTSPAVDCSLRLLREHYNEFKNREIEWSRNSPKTALIVHLKKVGISWFFCVVSESEHLIYSRHLAPKLKGFKNFTVLI